MIPNVHLCSASDADIVSFDETPPVRSTRDFLNDPERFVGHLRAE